MRLLIILSFAFASSSVFANGMGGKASCKLANSGSRHQATAVAATEVPTKNQNTGKSQTITESTSGHK